jgi:hypothetical protein
MVRKPYGLRSTASRFDDLEWRCTPRIRCYGLWLHRLLCLSGRQRFRCAIPLQQDTRADAHPTRNPDTILIGEPQSRNPTNADSSAGGEPRVCVFSWSRRPRNREYGRSQRRVKEMFIPNHDSIAAAYQEYLLALARKEADSGCERLFAFKGELPMYFAEVTASWSADDRYRLMCARIKRRLGHNGGAPRLVLARIEKRGNLRNEFDEGERARGAAEFSEAARGGRARCPCVADVARG